MHLIVICELAPPYCVIRPFILKLKIKSKPGSAFSNNIILLSKLFFNSFSKKNTSAFTFFSVTKFGILTTEAPIWGFFCI